MILALDIGNSATKGGIFEGGELQDTFVLPHSGTTDYSSELGAILHTYNVTHAGLCSVAPIQTAQLKSALPDIPLLEIQHDTSFAFPIRYETPETLGTDRLAAAAAVWDQLIKSSHSSAIIIDAGTAITLDVLTLEEGFLGGIIAAGPALMANALHDGTEQLPLVSLEASPQLIGRSTEEAIESGVVHGTAALVRGLLGELIAGMEGAPYVVLSGGWRTRLEQTLPKPLRVDEHLVLRGIASVTERQLRLTH